MTCPKCLHTAHKHMHIHKQIQNPINIFTSRSFFHCLFFENPLKDNVGYLKADCRLRYTTISTVLLSLCPTPALEPLGYPFPLIINRGSKKVSNNLKKKETTLFIESELHSRDINFSGQGNYKVRSYKCHVSLGIKLERCLKEGNIHIKLELEVIKYLGKACQFS